MDAADLQVTVRLRDLCQAQQGRYASPRLDQLLVAEGCRVSRRPPGLVFRTDRGSEYASPAFRDRLRTVAVEQGAKYLAHDNQRRLRSALGYRSPMDFDAAAA